MKLSDTRLLPKKLLDWYDRHARRLPWRRTKDPYKIWVSEIMLQQTRVATVVEYYKRWIRQFPTVQSLARASFPKVLHAWAGLGYYRRARMLHAGAKLICEKYAGRIPKTVEELKRLPGIGRYTAGAIVSIAFNEKAPLLDGNVIRILTRIFAIHGDISRPNTIAQLWKISEDLLPDKRPGDFNQAMMELGAMVCSPENPRCTSCPVVFLCKAHQRGEETLLPVRKSREKMQKISSVALVLRNEGSVLLKRQPKEARWGGLWMFPFWKNRQEMLSDTGLATQSLRSLNTIQYGFTKYRGTLKTYEHELKRREGKLEKIIRQRGGKKQWKAIKNLSQVPMPSPHRRIASMLK